MLVYPSLPAQIVPEVFERVGGLEPIELRARAATTHERLEYPPTGAVADERKVRAVAVMLRRLASAEGYPQSIGNSAHINFDHRAAGELHALMDISPWSAADEGVWAFLSLVVAPDVAVWRYPDRHPDRLLGGARNVFRRLWWRAELLGTGADDPPALLGEDQLVAIMERTDAIGSDSVVARALCKAVLRGQRSRSGSSSMMLMREAAKRVSRVTSVRLLPALSEPELEALMGAIVKETAQALSSTSKPTASTL